MEFTEALLLVIIVLADVLATVGPCEDAFSIHHIVLPFAFIATVVLPGILAITVDFVIKELTLILRAVWHVESANTMLLAILVAAFVSGIIWPSFETSSVLLVLLEFSNIFCDIIVGVHVFEDSVALSHIINEVAFIDISIRVNEPSTVVAFVVPPVPNVFCSIFPYLGSTAAP